MDKIRNNACETFGLALGYTFSYFIFTTCLFMILWMSRLDGKIPYVQVMGITLGLVVIGRVLRSVIK